MRPPEDPSCTAVYVPFKYDLGGRVVDSDGLHAALVAACGVVEVDQVVARSWNLSYLAGHAPVLRCVLPGGAVDFGSTRWTFQRTLRVFPWLGVISIDYDFEAAGGSHDLLEFYDGMVQWKNSDYLPYLQACGAVTPALAAHIATMSNLLPEQDLHAGLVMNLRSRLRPYLNARPSLYPFHDFRTCFVDTRSTLDDVTVQHLLWLSSSRAEGLELGDVARVRHGTTQISSTGWATVVRANGPIGSPEISTSLSMLSLVHAQWFICQSWINVYDRDFGGETGGEPQIVDVHELTGCQLSLARDLSEVANFDLMLKDPNLLRLARIFERAFGVLKHRDSAVERLRTLENHSRQLAGVAREKDLNRLQVLFSLSAAGSIAGLVPALAQIEFSASATTVTAILLMLLWLGFALNYAVVLRRLRVTRAVLPSDRSPWNFLKRHR